MSLYAIIIENIAVMVTLKLMTNWVLQNYPLVSNSHLTLFSIGLWFTYMHYCHDNWRRDDEE